MRPFLLQQFCHVHRVDEWCLNRASGSGSHEVNFQSPGNKYMKPSLYRARDCIICETISAQSQRLYKYVKPSLHRARDYIKVVRAIAS